MRPNTVFNISIQGRERNEQRTRLELERRVLALHIRDYQRAGVPLPEPVREQARRLGVEVML